MAELFHVNKYRYNDEITIEERHYEWFNTTERIIDGGICYPKYRRTYTKMVGVSSKTNKEVTHKHNTYMDLFDELKDLVIKSIIQNEYKKLTNFRDIINDTPHGTKLWSQVYRDV